MKILVTGGAGFIGSHIVEHFQQKAEVRVLDNLRSGYKKNLDPFNVNFIQGSVMEPETLQKAMDGVDFVFHLAAMISVPESMHKPVECVNINTIGTLNVLEAAAQAGVKKLCLSSSAAIYGDNPSVPKLENMFPEPKSPYAETKLSGEYYCGIYTRERGLPTTCLRYFNVFGPRQDPASQYAAAIPIFISRAVSNQPITIFGDGEQTRDFIFVKDIVAANVFFATESDCTGVFNVAYGGRITINDLAEKIVKLTNSQSEIVHLPERDGDVKHSQASVAKLRQAGFQPSFDFEAGLSSTIDYFSALAKN
jgi:UDP-glucose 4-epimerase